jgi:tripartite-type tricarboxylate transporter receptor subunit TctC
LSRRHAKLQQAVGDVREEKMPTVRRRSLLMGSVAATLGTPVVVEAQSDWPKGLIKFVVPFPPGGSTDPVARFIQSKLMESAGWQIVVENKPGAAGAIGAAIVAKSPSDGQTWLVAFDSHILISPFAGNNLPYKDSDLLNVMLVGRAPLAIACHPDRPYKNFADAVADARQRPGKPSVGVLTASQALLLITHLQKENDFDVNVIFYKGGAPTVQDLLAGVTDMALTTLAAVDPHIRSGKLRALATTGETRTPMLPDTPTLREQGIKGYPTYSWWGIYTPAGTPQPIVERRDGQGGALTRGGPQARGANRHGNPRHLARGLRRLPKGRAGTLDQDHQGERHQGRLR